MYSHRKQLPRIRSVDAFGAILLGCALSGRSLPAQTVLGRVTDTGGAAVSGAFVMLIDSVGRQRAALLADSAGRYTLTAPAPGVYRVRGERIGMETVTSDTLSLVLGQRRSLRLMLPDQAVALAALEVVGRNRCRLNTEAGEATSRAWEEVRKAMRVALWRRSYMWMA